MIKHVVFPSDPSLWIVVRRREPLSSDARDQAGVVVL
jgi:hypothetical protein